jgi:hypothetical protein
VPCDAIPCKTSNTGGGAAFAHTTLRNIFGKQIVSFVAMWIDQKLNPIIKPYFPIALLYLSLKLG